MPVNDVLEVKVFCRQAEQIGINVRHWRISATAGTEPLLTSVANLLSLTLAPLYKPVMALNAEYRGLTIQRLMPLPVTEAVASVSGAGTGTFAGDCLPRQVSGLIKLRTPYAGREFRGRVYIPFPSENANSIEGKPDAVYLALLDDLTALYGASLTLTESGGGNSVTLQPVIWHRETRSWTEVTGGITRRGWATQRRRGTYGRPNPVPVDL